MTFLLTVNDTWYPDWYNETCLQTVKTPPIQPNTSWNKSLDIKVGKCDHGPLTFQISEGELCVLVNIIIKLASLLSTEKDEKMETHTYLDVTFYSHSIEDAEPPTCKILWDYKYWEPTTYGAKESLLPGCFVMDSREGHLLTYYWFHVLDWLFA